MASTASDSRVMAWSRSACCPVLPEPGQQREPQVGQVLVPVGVVGWGGLDRLSDERDGLFLVLLLPRSLEPGLQHSPEVGEVPGPVGVVGRGGADRLAEAGNGVLEKLVIPGPLVIAV